MYSNVKIMAKASKTVLPINFNFFLDSEEKKPNKLKNFQKKKTYRFGVLHNLCKFRYQIIANI